MTRVRNHLLRGVLLSVLTGWSVLNAAGGGGSKNAGQEVEVVSAIGGRWYVEEAVWAEHQGAWRLHATLAPKRVSFDRLQVAELLQSFCGALLTSLPGRPTRLAGRQALYRVDLNARLGLDENGAERYLFKQDVPVAIKEGACQVSKQKRAVYFPTYPGLLTDWQVREIDAEIEDGRTTVKIVFRWEGTGKPANDSFPFLDACRLAMADPVILDSLTRIEAKKSGFEVSAVNAVEMTAEHRRGNFFAHFSTSVGQNFSYANGVCLGVSEGEAL